MEVMYVKVTRSLCDKTESIGRGKSTQLRHLYCFGLEIYEHPDLHRGIRVVQDARECLMLEAEIFQDHDNRNIQNWVSGCFSLLLPRFYTLFPGETEKSESKDSEVNESNLPRSIPCPRISMKSTSRRRRLIERIRSKGKKSVLVGSDRERSRDE